MPQGPLVILTQEAEDNAQVAGQLAARQIRTLSYPCLATRYLPFDATRPINGRSLASFPLLAFTSKRSVIGAQSARDVITRSKPAVACVGETTARAVKQMLGVKCSILPPEDQTGAGLARAIIYAVNPPTVVLYIRGDKTTGEFKRRLEEAGWEVHELVVYENYNPGIAPLELTEEAVAVFASPSAAKRFFQINGCLREMLACIAIGPITGDGLRGLGVKQIYEAQRPGKNDLVDTVISVLEQGAYD